MDVKLKYLNFCPLKLKAGVVVQAYDPSTQEAEAGGL
jgi:hypothetical protein